MFICIVVYSFIRLVGELESILKLKSREVESTHRLSQTVCHFEAREISLTEQDCVSHLYRIPPNVRMKRPTQIKTYLSPWTCFRVSRFLTLDRVSRFVTNFVGDTETSSAWQGLGNRQERNKFCRTKKTENPERKFRFYYLKELK